MSLNIQPIALKKFWIILWFGNKLFVILENAGNSYEDILRFISTNNSAETNWFFELTECQGTVHYGSPAPVVPSVEELILCPVNTCSSCVLLIPHFYPLLHTALTNDWPFPPKHWDIPAEISPEDAEGMVTLLDSRFCLIWKTGCKPQGWELGWIRQMGRSGTGFWGKNSFFRWVLVNIYIYNVQLNQVLRPWSRCVIKAFQKNKIINKKETQNPLLPSASLNNSPNLSVSEMNSHDLSDP